MSRSAAAWISEKNAAVLLLTTMSAVLLAKNENEVQSIEDNLIFNGTTRHVTEFPPSAATTMWRAAAS